MNNTNMTATPEGFSPKGKICVVTGGSRGIGKAIANELLSRDAKKVIIGDLVLEEQKLGSNLPSYKVDVGDSEDMKNFINAVYTKFETIDLFCANAGIASDDDIHASPKHWEKVWSVNMAQHTHASRECIPKMLKNGSGWFLITASAAGLLSAIGSATYSTTKHAAVGFAEWLSITYGGRGIGVSVLCPQAVRTAMTANTKNGGVAGIDGMMEPEEVAKITIDGMEEGRFLITPHMTVREYQKKKAENPERWIRGMRKLYNEYGNLLKSK